MRKAIVGAIAFLFLFVFAASTQQKKSAPHVKVSATASGGHVATLTWTASTDGASNPTLGYNVYRGTSPGQESSTPLNGSSLVGVGCSSTSTCIFADSTVTPGTWYYTVKASLNGVLSGASNEASGVVPLAPPTGLAATAQ